jgi:hypothetical protein
MTIGKGQSQIDEMGIDTQVVAELSRSGGLKGQSDRVVGAVVYAVRLGIMQEHVRR